MPLFLIPFKVAVHKFFLQIIFITIFCFIESFRIRHDCKYSFLYSIFPNESRFLWAVIQFPTLYFMSPKDISLTISSLVEISESDFVIQNSSSFFLMGRNGNSISSRCRKKWSYLRKFFMLLWGMVLCVFFFTHTNYAI